MNLSTASAAFLAFVSILAPSAHAQGHALVVQKPELRGGNGRRPVSSIVSVVYDVSLGRVRSQHTSAPGQIPLSTPCFDNSDIGLPSDPQYAVANGGEELLCWGLKNCPGAGRLRSFTIAYRSEAVDVSVGGPGASFSIALFQGAHGFGVPGTEVFRRTFTGMPANGAPASSTVIYDDGGVPFGEPMVFFTIDFGTDPLPFADGSIGWSFLQLDGDTGPVLVEAPKPLLGTVDAMDLYAPGPAVPATYVGTFNYGGYPYANMFVQLDEIANNEVANTTVLNGTGVNPLLLAEIFPARIGHIWAARIIASVPTIHPPPYTILFTSAAAFGPAPSPFGEILIDNSQRITTPLFGEGAYSVAIPADTTLIGFKIFMQGVVLPPALATITLTNALRVRVGY